MSTATLLEYRNLVGGELVDAVDGATREIVNPANGEGIGPESEGFGPVVTVQRVDSADEAIRLANDVP